MGDKRRAVIVDTTAFIAGFDAFDTYDEVYSIPEIERELTRGSMAKTRLKMAIRSGRLKIREPTSNAIREAERASKEMGDFQSLSEADRKIIALAIQLRDEGYEPRIITDDFSIQNVAKKLSIGYASITTHGIKYHLKWMLYCPACRKIYPPDYKFENCENCGTKLKRKPLSKTLICGLKGQNKKEFGKLKLSEGGDESGL